MPKDVEEAWGARASTGSGVRESISGVAANLKDWSANVLSDLEK